MKKLYTYFTVLLTVFVSNIAIAQFDSGDSTILQNIMNTNFSSDNMLNWNDPNPANWLGVTWDSASPRRVIQLDLKEDGSGGGSIQGAGWSVQMASVYQNKYEGFGGSGVDSRLLGNVDFSGLSALEALDLRRNDSITSVNVSGLNNLKYFSFCRQNLCDSLDLSNLSNLQFVQLSRAVGLTHLDVSNCPRLKRIKASFTGNNLKWVDISGSDSLIQLNLKTSGLTSLDLTGKSELRKVSTGSSDSLATVIGLSTLSKLFALGLGRGMVDMASIDILDFDTANLYKLSIRGNQVKSVENLLLLDTMETINILNNNLTLTNAVQIDNFPGVIINKVNGDGANQTRYGGITIAVGDSVDYSAEALINVNGVDTATTFTLFDEVGAQVGATNMTGVFNFLLAADTGKYYVEMTNLGVTLTTDTIIVISGGGRVMATIDVANFGNVSVGTSKTQTLTINNTGNLDINVSNITVPTGYSISSTTGTIVPAASSTYTVTFNPTAVQAYNGDITVVSDALLTGTDVVAITGRGVSGVGIEESLESIKFYPNPTTGLVTIEGNTDYRHLQVYSVVGKLVKTVNVLSSNIIDIREMENGIYFIKSVDGIINQKIVKK